MPLVEITQGNDSRTGYRVRRGCVGSGSGRACGRKRLERSGHGCQGLQTQASLSQSGEEASIGARGKGTYTLHATVQAHRHHACVAPACPQRPSVAVLSDSAVACGHGRPRVSVPYLCGSLCSACFAPNTVLHVCSESSPGGQACRSNDTPPANGFRGPSHEARLPWRAAIKLIRPTWPAMFARLSRWTSLTSLPFKIMRPS